MTSGSISDHSRQRPKPLRACPTPPESLAFPTYWYRLPNDENFLICTKCYEDKLHSTQFASLLRCDYLDFGPGATAVCDFSTPRTDSLLRQAVTSNDFQLLGSFAERRMSITSCSGTEGIKGCNDVKWFKPINDEISGFICCEACYEDVVLGTVFGPIFIPCKEQQEADQTWSCDLAVPYLKHSLQACAPRGDWHAFVQAARHRLSLPECVIGVPVLASARRWYNTVRPSPIHDMSVCEACYLDRAGWQDGVAQYFTSIAFNPTDLSSRFTCDFKPAPMAGCCDILLAHSTFDKWHHFASLIMSKATCEKEGIVDGEWYGLPDPTDPTKNVEEFDICAACHAGFNQSADWGHIFRRLSYPLGTTRVCNFNPSTPRYSTFCAKWNQMYFTRDPAPFIDYVSRLAPLPLCQGKRRLENASWYGDEDACLLICPSCFEEVVRGTHFAPSFPLQHTLLPEAHHCSLYSSGMRGKYFEACELRSLDSLLSFAAQREQVYQQCVPQIEAFLASQQQKMELLKIASGQRAHATASIAVGRGFMGGPPIVHNYDPMVVGLTISYNNLLTQLQCDPQRTTVMQLEAQWQEVE